MRTLARIGLSVLLTCSAIAGAHAQQRLPDVTDADRAVLKSLRQGHPRLIGLASDLDRVKRYLATDPVAQRWRDGLRRQAERILTEPPVEHVLIGPRLLDKSRRVLDRVYTLALMYRLEGDRRFAERARTEMLTVAAFKDWNPSHFLDVAEMTHAVAIGYDWLYDYLSPDDRRTLKRAIVELGLQPSLDLYRGNKWWTAVTHNWNQVCNGGMTLGALAIADEEPDLAAYIVSHAVKSVKLAMASYAPDGGWAEGPGYWNYATSYNVYMLAGLESALGTVFSLDRMPGFAETGLFPLYFTGPNGRTFNYADSGEREGNAPCLFWLARHFDRPTYAWMERQFARNGSATDLLWYDPRGSGPAETHVPLDARYKGIDVAFLRSAWEDPNAVFVGFKGGDNRANHSHLDLGTFVLDADGKRWASDLGSDDYNLPGYFGKQRFTYYRLMTTGHNTLVLDGANQNAGAKAPIVAYGSTASRSYAVADLTAAYAGQATSVRRGIAMLDRRRVLVEDEVTAAHPIEIAWTLHTPSQATVDGGTATLRQPGATLTLQVLAPAGARFRLEDANPPAPQHQNPGISKLVLSVPAQAGTTRVAVLISPGTAGPAAAPPRIAPLADWPR